MPEGRFYCMVCEVLSEVSEVMDDELLSVTYLQCPSACPFCLPQAAQ